jgi:hypothetical protein
LNEDQVFICINNVMQNKKSNGHGGARPGAGRKPGSGNKIRLEDLLSEIEHQAGMSYAERLATNYVGAITRADWSKVSDYDRAFLNKVVADKQEVEMVESEDNLAAKKLAFQQALAAITTINPTKKAD